jgi:hypothetical protein
LKYPLLSSIKPSYNQMMVLFLAVYDDAATWPYTFKCCNSKLTDSGFGAWIQFMLETLLGKVW